MPVIAVGLADHLSGSHAQRREQRRLKHETQEGARRQGGRYTNGKHMDLDRLLEIDLDYPGISFGYHSWSVRVYLENLEEFIAHTGDQYRLRAERALGNKRHELGDEVYHQKLGYIDQAADQRIPGYARMSAVVLLWGMLETTVSDMARYLARREAVSKELGDIKRRAFLYKAQQYYECVLGIQLPWTEPQKQGARSIQFIRNAIAHRYGQYMSATEKEKERFRKRIQRVPGVELGGSELVISREYLQGASHLVFTMLEDLNDTVCTRYRDLSILRSSKEV